MSDESEATLTTNKGKGKARDVTERTPLLANGSSSSARSEDSPPPDTRRRLRRRLVGIFLITLLICISALVLLVLLAWSYSSRASDMSPDDILHEALVLQGPDRLDVLNISISEGIWVNVEGRIGLDAGAVVGVNSDPEDGILDKIWKSFGRSGIRNLDTVSIWTSTVTILSRSDPPVLLATIDIPPLEIPLTVDPPTELTWLQPISAPIFIRPTSNTSDLLHFVRDSWRNGQMVVKTEVPTVDVRGGELAGTSWKHRLHRQLLNVKTGFSMQGVFG